MALDNPILPTLQLPSLGLTLPNYAAMPVTNPVDSYNASMAAGQFTPNPTPPLLPYPTTPSVDPLTLAQEQMQTMGMAVPQSAPMTTAPVNGNYSLNFNYQLPQVTPPQSSGGGGNFLTKLGGDALNLVGSAAGEVGKAVSGIQHNTIDPLVGTVGDVVTRGELPPSYSAAQQRGAQLTSGSGLPLPLKAVVQTVSNPVQLGIIAAEVAATVATGGLAAPALAASIGSDLAVQTGVTAGMDAAMEHANQIPGFRDLNPNEQQAVLLGASILAAKYGTSALGKAADVTGVSEAVKAGAVPGAAMMQTPRIEEAVNAMNQADAILSPEAAPVPEVHDTTINPEKAATSFEGPAREILGGEGGNGAGVPPTGNSGGDELNIPPPSAPKGEPAMVGPIPLPSLQPEPMSYTDKMLNLMRPITGGVKYDEYATPAMRWYMPGYQQMNSLANHMVGQAIVDLQRVFPANDIEDLASAAVKGDATARIAMDGNHFTSLPGNPTLSTLLARLPDFQPFLTADQFTALTRLGQSIEPYAQQLRDMGVDIGQREDIMDGGYYFPRGRADLEGADEPLVTKGSRGGKLSAAKAAVFESQEAGEAAGYTYAPWQDAYQSLILSAARKVLSQHLADYFKGITDDEGNPLATTPADRINPAMRAKYQTLTAQAASLRGRINTALSRAGRASGSADELDRALDAITVATPDNPASLVKLPDVLAALQDHAETAQDVADLAQSQPGAEAPASFRAGPFGATSTTAPSDAYTIARDTNAVADGLNAAAQNFERALPEDVDRLARLESTLRQSGKRLDVLRTRGEDYASRAGSLQGELDDIQSALDEMRPDYQDAVKRAQQMPRGTTQVGDMLPELSNYALPNRMADVIRDQIGRTKPASGRGAALSETLDAASILLRSLKFTGGALSWVGVHGLTLASEDPLGMGRAMGRALQSTMDPLADGLHASGMDERLAAEGLPSLERATASGLYDGRTAELVQFGLENGSGNFVNRMSGALARAPIVKNLTNAWVVGTNAARRELYFDMVKRARDAGNDVFDNDILARITNAANEASGYSTNRLGGNFGDMVLFAPRLIRAQLDEVGNALKGVGNAVRPGAQMTIEQSEAIRGLVHIMGTMTLLSAGLNYLTGEKTPWKQFFDPLNPEFMRFQMKGEHWSLFGPWDTLMRSFAALSTGGAGMANAIAHMNGTDFTGNLHSAIDYGVRGQVSPLAGIVWDYLTHSNVVGQKMTPAQYLQEVLPIDLENVPGMPGRRAMGGAGVLAQQFGVKNTPLTPTQQLNAIAQAQFGKQWNSLLPSQQQAIKTAHPDIWQDKINTMSTQTQRYYNQRTYYTNQQEADDQQLISGKMDRATWLSQYQDRQQALLGAENEIFGPNKAVANPKTPVQRYGNIIAEATDRNTGAVDWNMVDAGIAKMSPSDQQWVADERSVGTTPVTAKYRQAASEEQQYAQLSTFPGYTGQESNQLMDLYYGALSYAGAHFRSYEPGLVVAAISQLSKQGYSQKVVGGAIAKATGALPYLPYQRWNFGASHPLLGIFYGTGGERGNLTPKEVQVLES